MAKFYKSTLWDKVPKGNTLIFGDTQIFLKHSVVQVEESFHAKTSSIRPVVSIQRRLVTDGQTDGHMTTAYTATAWRRAAKIVNTR